MLYHNLLRHQWKEFIRNPSWSGISVAYAIFLVLLALYFLLVLAISGAMIGRLLKDHLHDEAPSEKGFTTGSQSLLDRLTGLGFVGSLYGMSSVQIEEKWDHYRPFFGDQPLDGSEYIRNLSEGNKKKMGPSHDLNHITEVCRRIAVIKRGVIVRDINTAPDTLRELERYFAVEKT